MGRVSPLDGRLSLGFTRGVASRYGFPASAARGCQERDVSWLLLRMRCLVLPLPAHSPALRMHQQALMRQRHFAYGVVATCGCPVVGSCHPQARCLGSCM